MIYILNSFEAIIILLIILIILANCLKLNNNNKKLCINCKWFIPNNNPEMKDYGTCKIFKNVLQDTSGEKIIYDYASHCRINEDMCGKTGYLFEPSNETALDELNEKMKVLQTKYDEAVDRFSVEILENEEIKEIESDIREINSEIYILTQEMAELQEHTNDLYNEINIFEYHIDEIIDDLQKIKKILNI
jgi:hypothetical protein